jgi:hypothetical protein
MIQHIYHAWPALYTVLYKCRAPKGEILQIMLQHCIGLNIPEPLDLLSAVESVEELFDWI